MNDFSANMISCCRWNIVQQFGDCDGRSAFVDGFCVVHDLVVLDMGGESTSNEENALWMVQGGSTYLSESPQTVKLTCKG